MTTAIGPVVARRLRITGVVQGVGFRPFVHRLALRHGLVGSVRNVAGEVQIGVQGDIEAVAAFVEAVRNEAPALARIEHVTVEPLVMAPCTGFVIAASIDPAGHREPVSPDAAICAACERELFDPENRRFRYPFITCTDCGPRFTVIDAMPYDRERTSMRRFVQCPACQQEYRSPADRRYHSQTNSCPACGPRLWFEGASAADAEAGAEGVLARAVSLLQTGGILAIRGLGGFHLAVDATSNAAVTRLRQRKHRDAKPFAVMVRTVEAARALVDVSADAAELLTSTIRPVVVLPARPGNGLSDGIAPRLGSIGVLLPSTPLHHLLLAAFDGPVVMTSGNLSDDPIATANDEARRRLAAIADGFLLHDREIVSRYDDSVLRPTACGPLILRRARGLAPLPIQLPVASPEPLIAVGADLKNTFTLVDRSRAYVSQHIGDLGSLETLMQFHATLQRFQRLFHISPTIAVRDMHPGYFSTRIADELGLSRVITVQHHHAHIAAVLAEHGEPGPVIGIAFDGTGYGDDGHTWGAEVLLVDRCGYRRLAHLRYAPMPGGDLAAREPWRAALGYLSLDGATACGDAFDDVPVRSLAVAQAQIARKVNAPLVSSIGRLFDAASAIIGAHAGKQFEGQAAMELEALAGRRTGRVVNMPVTTDADGMLHIDPLPLLIALGDGRRRSADAADLAADFHDSLVAATARAAADQCERFGVRTVALGGGVFQNARLATGLPDALVASGLRVLTARRLGPNDGAISYGQAAVASARLIDDNAGNPVGG